MNHQCGGVQQHCRNSDNPHPMTRKFLPHGSNATKPSQTTMLLDRLNQSAPNRSALRC